MTFELGLADKVGALDSALTNAGVAHAFGGAIALAYYAEPRATIDIDVNVFVAPDSHDGLTAALAALGVEAELAHAERDGQTRVLWGRTPLDFFFAYLPLHDAMREGLRTVPFGDQSIPILAPEHLIVCKALFSRPKDWLDIEQVVTAGPAVDTPEVLRWVRDMVGMGDARYDRLTSLLGA